MFKTTQSTYSPSQSNEHDVGTESCRSKKVDKVNNSLECNSESREQRKVYCEPQPRGRTTSKNFNDRRQYELDTIVLSRRQKQIDFGKNTLAYDRYRSAVSRDERTKDDPRTPLKHLKMNRRSWDGLVKNWKLKLHRWDAENSIRSQTISHIHTYEPKIIENEP